MSLTPLLLDFTDQEQFHPTEMSEGENDCEKAVRPLTSTIWEKLDEGAKKTKSFSSACIFRVPGELRKLNESTYTPHLIAIGPLHRDNPHLPKNMQHVKMCYVNHLLGRLTKGMEDRELAEQRKFTVLKECVEAIKASMDHATKFYAEEVAVDEEMMLVDGCFILEVLYRYYHFSIYKEKEKGPINGEYNGNFEGEETTDPIFDNNLTICTIQHDLLLLENQIPFFVLEKLFQLTVAQIPEWRPMNWPLTNYVFHFFHHMMSPVLNSTKGYSSKTSCSPDFCDLWDLRNRMTNSNHDYYHILHDIHDDYLPHDKPKTFSELMPCASQLIYAGVKFVPGSRHDLFKVKFTEPKGLFWWCHRARFEIPHLGIYDLTESFLRNLIAFEQCCPGVPQQFTSYAYLMDMLVNSDKDVRELERAGVLRNYLGVSEDVICYFFLNVLI